jgi:hypothetical protein
MGDRDLAPGARPAQQGFLVKKGGGTRLIGRTSEKKRYFVLQADGRLAYYVSRRSYLAREVRACGRALKTPKRGAIGGGTTPGVACVPGRHRPVARPAGGTSPPSCASGGGVWGQALTFAATQRWPRAP